VSQGMVRVATSKETLPPFCVKGCFPHTHSIGWLQKEDWTVLLMPSSAAARLHTSAYHNEA